MKNWKTTVTGIITGSIVILQTINAPEKINWYQITIGFAIMVLGVLAKDFDNVTAATVFSQLPAEDSKFDASKRPKMVESPSTEQPKL